MRKNTILSIIALLLCFLIGAAAYQATSLVASWIGERLSDCQAETGAGCAENPETPREPRRRH